MLTFNASTGSARTMTYDNNGNMTTVTNSCGTTSYTWDARNRLSSISGFTADCSQLTAAFKYVALGRRIEKTVNNKTTDYLYEGLDIIQEIENGAVSANYLRTLRIDEPLARLKSDGTTRYYQADALGSIIALTDENGTVKTQYNYDPFGNTEMTSESSDNPFQYTGRENDGTGLYYYRARYYSSELQRFISEDPIGLAGGINQFAYVDNTPLNFIDPYGLFGLDTISEWIVKQALKQTGKYLAKKVIPDTGLNMPEEGDDDHDGIPNYIDPNSEHCKVNCEKPPDTSKCH